MSQPLSLQPDAPRSHKPAATLRLKLLLGYGGTLILWSLLSLDKLGDASSAILSENYRSIAATHAMTSALARQERSLFQLSGASGRESAQQTFHAGEAQFLQSLGRARDNITIDEEQPVLDTIESRYTPHGLDTALARQRRGK